MRRLLLVAALCLLIALGGALTAGLPHLTGKAAPLPDLAPAAPVNLLVLGVDERPDDPGRSDAMLLVRIGDGQVRTLAIPRDTLVDMGEHGEGKANSAYTYGGPALAKATVANLLGLPVDHHLKVNLAGFRALVDLLGGVPIEVERPMYYEDPYDDLVIDLKPGQQVLNGSQAEQYVRFRHDEQGDDLGRMVRQQRFLKAAALHALRPVNLPRLPGLLAAAATYVETDLTFGQQLVLAKAALRAHQAGAVVHQTLPGQGEYVDEISFFLPDPVELQELLQLWRGR